MPARGSQEILGGSSANEKIRGVLLAQSNAPPGTGTRIPVPSPPSLASCSTGRWPGRRANHLYTRAPTRAGDADEQTWKLKATGLSRTGTARSPGNLINDKLVNRRCSNGGEGSY
ncbi:MAG: hypothetical protein ACR2IV_06355 [Bryobacteraceae bacterium]